jgi:hypothetical protein
MRHGDHHYGSGDNHWSEFNHVTIGSYTLQKLPAWLFQMVPIRTVAAAVQGQRYCTVPRKDRVLNADRRPQLDLLCLCFAVVLPLATARARRNITIMAAAINNHRLIVTSISAGDDPTLSPSRHCFRWRGMNTMWSRRYALASFSVM